MSSLVNYDLSKDAQLFPQSISVKSKDLESVITNVIMNEKGKASRILYIGPNYSGSGMALYRVIELSRGNNYLEKVVFDKSSRSVYSTLIYLQRTHFHRLTDPHREAVNNNYLKDSNVLTSNTLYREYNGGHIRSNIIFETKNSYVNTLFNFYTYWKLRSYSKK